MSEIEFKFHIPATQYSKLHHAIQEQQPKLVHLAAYYYDTPSQALSKVQISLRQRLENTVWTQTLKAPSSHHAKRIEIEETLDEKPNGIDLKRYVKNKQAQALLKPVLASKQPLILQFRTEVKRLNVQMNHGDSHIEIALDQGWLIAAHQKVKISEIEFELKKGQISDLIVCLQPWVKQYHLYLDVQSKAARGYALLNTQPQAATYAQNFSLSPTHSSELALKQMIASCLQHILPNASAIALGDYQASHVHQLRVGIRRLRSVLKSFADWTTHDLSLWQQQLKSLFQHLGSTRDYDALVSDVLPALQNAGAPFDSLPQAKRKSHDLSQHFREPSTSLLWLDLLNFSQQDSSTHQAQDLTPLAGKQIGKLQRKITGQSDNFMQLSTEQKHQLRKQVKQLRYSLEFTHSLFKSKQVKHYLKTLKPLQEVLGEFNDLCVAEEYFKILVNKQREYWFALGWISAQQQQVLSRAHVALQQFSRHAEL